MKWIPTGSSVSGTTAGYELYHDGRHGEYAVVLRLGPFFAPTAAHLIPCGTYDDATAHGERFMHAVHRYEALRRVLAFAATGGCFIGDGGFPLLFQTTNEVTHGRS